jgi:hypothetical protein
MEYISLSWYDIPELVVPIGISLIEGCCQQWSYCTKGSSWLSWNHFETFTYGRHHDLVDRYGVSVSQMITDMFHLS